MSTMPTAKKYTKSQALDILDFVTSTARIIRTEKRTTLKAIKKEMEDRLNIKLKASGSSVGGEFYRGALCRAFWSIERKRTREECLTALSAKEHFYNAVLKTMEKKA